MLRTDSVGYPRRTLMSMMHYFVFVYTYVIFLFHLPIFVSTLNCCSLANRNSMLIGKEQLLVFWLL
jgi:hypothetical protein